MNEGIRTILELIVFGLLFYGFVNEDKVVEFERNIFNKLTKKWRDSNVV